MSNYINITIVDRYYTLYDNQSYKKASAISTLKQIESIIVKEFSNYYLERGHLEVLREGAKRIHDGYFEKSSRLSSFRRWIGNVSKKEKEITNVYEHIEKLINSPYLLGDLPNEKIQQIFSHLSLLDHGKLCSLNGHVNGNTKQALLNRAQEYGYQGDDYHEANNYLKNSYSSLKKLISTGFIPDNYIIYHKHSTSKIDLEKTLNNLKNQRRSPKLQNNLNFALGLYINHRNKIEIIKLLLFLGADPDNTVYQVFNDTPLMRLFNGGGLSEFEIVERMDLLLNAGADIQKISLIFGQSPLHIACIKGYSHVVSYLIKHGADVNLSIGGNTPLINAMLISTFSSHHEQLALEIVILLLEAGADLTGIGNGRFKDTPLHTAVRCEYKNIVSLLLSRGAQIDALNGSGYTPLHLAAKRENEDIINILIYKRANRNIENPWGFKAYELVPWSGYLRRLLV